MGLGHLNGRCSHTPVPGTKMLGKGNNYQQISNKSGVVASSAYEKLNTTGTDENLFRVDLVAGHAARVLALELLPMPEHGAQIRARAPSLNRI